MKRKELTKTFINADFKLKKKNTLVSMVYVQIFQRFKGQITCEHVH